MSHYICNYLCDLLDLLPLEHRHKSPLTRNQHKPLNQPFPPREKTKRKEEYNPTAWEKETSSGQAREKKNDEKRNTAQMKEQGRNSQDQINKEEISNQPEKQFIIMIVKML